MSAGKPIKAPDIDESGDVLYSTACEPIAIIAINDHATAARYLHVYNTATAPDENATPAMEALLLPAQDTREVGIPQGMGGFDKGLAVRATTVQAEGSTTAVGANEVAATAFIRVL